MITNGFRSRPLAIGALIQFLNRRKWIFTLATAAIVTVAATAPPPVSDENTDEEYIRIMNLMDRADALRATGKPDAAKAKDREAYRSLMLFKRAHPKWNSTSVEYRLNELTQDIEGKPPESEAPTKSKAHTNLEAPSKRTSTETKSSTAVVKLVDAGAEPRKALRLHVKAGDKQSMTVTVKTSMEGGATAQPNAIPSIPAISLPIDVAVQNVAANGDITYEMTFSEAAIADQAGVPPQVAQAMKTALDGLKGVTASGVMSDRGVSKKVDIKLPPNASQQARQMVEQMKGNMLAGGSELPEEPVGTGAKWQAKAAVKLAGMSMDQATDYQLVSIEGDHLSVSSTQTQSGSGPKAQNATGSGTTMTNTTTGNIAIDLSKLVPLQATMESHSEVNGMKIGVNITIESH